MKKRIQILIIGLLLINTLYLNAQVRFSIRGGLNLANMTIKGLPEGADLNIIPSFHIGAGVEYSFTQWLALETDLLLSGKGTKMTYTSTFSGITYTGKAKISPYYLEIPINVVYKTSLQKLDLHLFAGPYFGVGLFGKIKKEYTASGLPPGVTLESMGIKNTTSDLEFGTTDDSYLKRADFGLNVGLGIEFKHIQFRGQYGFSLINLDPKGIKANNTKNRVIAITIGYMFE